MKQTFQLVISNDLHHQLLHPPLWTLLRSKVFLSLKLENVKQDSMGKLTDMGSSDAGFTYVYSHAWQVTTPGCLGT